MPPSRTLSALLSAFVILSLGSVGSLPPAGAADANSGAWRKVDPLIRAQAQKSLTARSPAPDIEVMIGISVDPDQSATGTSTTRAVEVLQSEADHRQRPIVDLVTAHGGVVQQQFWISNMVLATVPADAIGALADVPAVDRIIPNVEVSVPNDTVVADKGAVDAPTTWGIDRIRADDVTADLGLTGDGVKVAVLDTGIDAQHPDLRPRLFTADSADPTFPGGWIEFDAAGEVLPSTPHETGAHGTHVAGTVAGGDASGTRIGVAPGAELMVAAVLPGGTGTLAQVLAGMQWAMAPTDRHGNPAGEPADVVNMSLGSITYASEFIEPTRNMYSAGVFPAFSIGNWCDPGTSSSPGNVYEAISVGATDSNDDVGEFSCGEMVHREDFADPPAEWPQSWVVPDVSAPGVDVLSALPDSQYGAKSGTSMAAPHVAGTVALMLEADPDLSVDSTLAALCGTAYFDDRYGATRPNARYGCGRIDAWGAVASVFLDSGISGTVTHAKSGEPLTDVLVSAGGQVRRTSPDGRYDLRLLPGTYDVTFSLYGYVSHTVADVVVEPELLQSHDLELTEAADGQVRGAVRYGPTGVAVPGATVRLLAGDQPSTTTSRAGTYALRGVPAGTWQLQASSPGLTASEPVEVSVTGKRPPSADLSLPGAPAIERVSLAPDGSETDGTGGQASLSADGRWIAYHSNASAMDPTDHNGQFDIFVEDRLSGVVQRISRAYDGTDADLGSSRPVISADGRWIAFESAATNLVPGDTNGRTDVFLHDRHAGTTSRISVGPGGLQGDGHSTYPAISPEGTWVAFESVATTLVPGDTNRTRDVFLYDATTGELRLESRSASGDLGDGASYAPSLSAGAEFLVYHSFATNLLAGADTNGRADVMVLNRSTRVVQRASVNSQWSAGNGHAIRATVSDDGRYVAYESSASNLAPNDVNGVSDIFVRDRVTFTTQCLTCSGDAPANGASTLARISGNGSMVAYQSLADNLVPQDSNRVEDIFITAVATRHTDLVSTGDTVPGNLPSALGAISDDGKVVAFQSFATTLAGPDTNGYWDVYLRDLQPDPAQPRFVVSGLRSVVDEDSELKVTVHVTNLGRDAGEYTVGVYVDGSLTATSPIAVDGGDSRTVTVRIDSAPGVHEVRVGPLTATYSG